MKIKPNLIPRLNYDYNFQDFTLATSQINRPVGTRTVRLAFGRNAVFYHSGRTALYSILKCLDLPKGSRVGVPLYCCRVVFDAIRAAGCRPIFIDSELDTYTLSIHDLSEKENELDALVPVHMFGHPCDMDAIMDIMGEKPVIEDCAHSPFSRYKGKLTGTLGTASFFTSGYGKYLYSGGGGFAICSNRDLERRLIIHNKQELKPAEDCIKHTLYNYALSKLYHRPWFGLFTLPVGKLFEDGLDPIGKSQVVMKKMKQSDMAVLMKNLKLFRSRMQEQVKNAKIMRNALEDLPLRFQEVKDWAFTNHYLFPIRFRSRKERDQAAQGLHAKGIDTMRFYSDTPSIAWKEFGYRRDCRKSEHMAKTILIVPHYYSLSDNDVKKVIKAIRTITS